ncbi:murein biosynthesis integral membrane protein MurJ [Granulicoccus phenolivorans]|uniref:murein biosynthesis integral membrane protein MurJ n=1 Tax=Granulicoccus phenolivorans TaxID=266854 RepID=UPI0011AE6BC8|nr:murein biosynthesis integral membrane protein MurJ [Granulicoccus phenolivorans]
MPLSTSDQPTQRDRRAPDSWAPADSPDEPEAVRTRPLPTPPLTRQQGTAPVNADAETAALPVVADDATAPLPSGGTGQAPHGGTGNGPVSAADAETTVLPVVDPVSAGSAPEAPDRSMSPRSDGDRPDPDSPADGPDSPGSDSADSADSPGPDSGTADRDGGRAATSRLLSAGALMAAGTMVSRILGFVRVALLAFVLGNGTRQADMFNIATTIPTSLYILFAGGALNTVLVPQLVRAAKNDADGGEAYTNRIITAFSLLIGAVTLILTVGAPVVTTIYSADAWRAPELAEHWKSMVFLAYLCMPQVFFYGVFFLLGQVLNARDHFGPMMWAPIANNIIQLLVLGLYLGIWGTSDGASPFTGPQAGLLGGGATFGIIVQSAVMVIWLRKIGYRYRPRFDLKGQGLGHTFHLAKWTLGFVAVNQLVLVVVDRLATSATAGGSGAGLTVYNNAYLMFVLPHSLITVSLATAMLPSASRLAANGDLAGVREETLRTIRLATSLVLPAAVAFLALAHPVVRLLFGHGAGAEDAAYVGWTLMAFAIGLVPFTVQYICLRAFYALEDTRSTFFIQIAIGAVNVIAGVGIVYAVGDPAWVAPSLALAYSLSYVVGLAISFHQLSRKLPDLRFAVVAKHLLRVFLAVAPAGLLAWGITTLLASDSVLIEAAVLLLAAVVALVVFFALARLIRITEVTSMLDAVLRRVRRRGGGSGGSGDSGDSGGSGGPEGPPGPDGDDPGTGPAADPDAEAETRALSTAATELGSGQSAAAPGLPEADSGTLPLPRDTGADGTDEYAGNPAGEDTLDPGPPTDPGPSPAYPVAPAATPQPRYAMPMYADRPASAASAGEDPDTEETNPLEVGDAADEDFHPIGGRVGDTLGNRYQLQELLVRRPTSETWRALDDILSRSVLIHRLAPEDPNNPLIMNAARRAAAATDARFLRVLDVIEEDPAGPFVVCEFVPGENLATLLTAGPLSALEGAWVVREVADALAGMHAQGLYHRRISPDTVVITAAGGVKIVGFLLEAAIEEPGTVDQDSAEQDTTDLGRLLYATLVSRWPGGPAYGLAAAPTGSDGTCLTPRQVRAGVSPALDGICDRILSLSPRQHGRPITSAKDVAAELSAVLGTADASHDLERRLRYPVQVVTFGEPAVPARSARSPHTPAGSVPGYGPGEIDADATAPQQPIDLAGPDYEPEPVTDPTRPVHRPPSGRHQTWRPWLRILVAVVIGILICSLIVVAVTLNRNRSGTTAPKAATGPVVLSITGAKDFDPEGATREENPDQVALSHDGNPSTAWHTVVYNAANLSGKSGVGVYYDLGREVAVSQVRLTLVGTGTNVQIRVPDRAGDAVPTDSATQWRTVGEADRTQETTEIAVSQVSTRYVLVWLTSIPGTPGNYQGGIAEVEFIG